MFSIIGLALIGWPFIVLGMFYGLPSRQAAASGLIGAWLVLPPTMLAIPGFPDYSKDSAAVFGVLLGTLVVCPDRFTRFRFRWYDVPMTLWCLTTIITSVLNGLGLYDGLSDAMTQTVRWGLPYFVGRLHFGDFAGLRALATTAVVGAVWYIPFCVIEMRLSTSLMMRVYGIGTWGSGGGLRFGLYRPSVFFTTGLELGMYMTAAVLAGWWLWRCGTLEKVGRFQFGRVVLPILTLVTILCRATGALVLLLLGMGILRLSARFKTRLLVICLLIAGPLYVSVRVPQLWSGRQAVELARFFMGSERSGSLEWRFLCEDQLIVRAMQQPTFGWGRFGRSDAFDQNGKRVDTDGMWIILFGQRGLVGLVLVYLSIALPAILFVGRFPARQWADPRVAAGSLTAVFLGLYVIDCLMNGFMNMIYLALAGGLAGLDPRQLAITAAPALRWTGARPALGAATRARALMPPPDRGPIALADRFRLQGRSFKDAGRVVEADLAWQKALDVLSSPIEAVPASSALSRQWCDCANDLVWLRVNHPDSLGSDLNTSLTMARRMVDEYPDNEGYWNTLGVACYRAGLHAEAVAALERASELGGGNVFDEVFLAMAHARLGDLELARVLLERALRRAETEYPGHRELGRFCDEARSIVAGGIGAPAAAR